MTTEDYADVHKEFSQEPENKRKALYNIAKLLKEESFTLPTLEEVMTIFKKIDS